MQTKASNKRARIKVIKLLLTPLTEDEVARCERYVDEDTPQDERDAIELPPQHFIRLKLMATPALARPYLVERQALQYQVDCEDASEANQAVLKDPAFLRACEAAETPPTRRQASKWRNGRRGLALWFRHQLAA